MDSNSILMTVSLVISILSIVLGVINHRKIRSKCCGVNLGETSLDITTTTPDIKNNNST